MPDRVVLDPSRVRQIMLNLLSNSVKYALTRCRGDDSDTFCRFTETGEIRVAVAAVPALGEGGVGRVRITVSDTGIGISAQARDKIFKPFSQGTPTRLAAHVCSCLCVRAEFLSQQRYATPCVSLQALKSSLRS